jgi:hypothetical protein
MNKIFRIAVFFVMLFNDTFGNNITAVSSGNWGINNTWSCNCLPTNADNVTIPNGITVTNTNSRSFAFGPVITLKVAGKLIINNSFFSYDATDIISIVAGGSIQGSGGLGGLINSGLAPVFIASGNSIDGPSLITNGVLPVKLLSFEGHTSTNGITLEWASATEQNFSHYTIERSNDGTQFEVLGKIPAANGLSGHRYTFDDTAPFSGKSYYRLNAADLDETSEILSMIMVTNDRAAKTEVTVFPNPLTSESLSVKLNNLQEADYEIEVFDSQGARIAGQKVSKDILFSTLQLLRTSGKYYLVSIKMQGGISTTSVLVK